MALGCVLIFALTMDTSAWLDFAGCLSDVRVVREWCESGVRGDCEYGLWFRWMLVIVSPVSAGFLVIPERNTTAAFKYKI